ncbi:hypothetical protein [Halobacterium salinarum]|uniref:hypothetical protein n=1 Tax=Halobacterium salinarum TaxID=2242 RepID=UPI0025570463|nr:hypothetical protein [Halobacterium salinarum]MDL0126641.1 hypothetical protein [Halobacterium salinarum]
MNEYINESKRLFTVRQKNVLFKHLYSFGARTLERKHAVEITWLGFGESLYSVRLSGLSGPVRASNHTAITVSAKL